MSEVTRAVCSISPTRRRRYFWAAWWTHPPKLTPFQKPDASNGGARSDEEAFAEAEQVAGRHLARIDPFFALTWNRILRGEPAPTRLPEPRSAQPSADRRLSAWTLLGVLPGSDLTVIKRAYRERAFANHPDRGGDPAVFRALQRAYEKLVSKASKHTSKTHPKR